MSDFSQKHMKVTNLYLLGRDTRYLRPRLRLRARNKRPVLVIPTLATEFTHEENRPVFENIVSELRNLTYLNHIIFGLDAATDDEALLLADILKKGGLKNFLIQHNQGPGFTGIYDQFSQAGFGLNQPGKGRNMFISFGVAQALGAGCVGLVDADIKTFARRQLDRLFYPVLVLDYQFSKAFYSRISEGQMYGRVKRLLLDPLLLVFQRKFSESEDMKLLRIIDFLQAFKYQLSGEVVFDMSLLKRMHFATNWGVEIFTLIEVYRKATNIAQVQISMDPFDHKHQQISEDNIEGGLFKMAIDIVTTILSTLVVEEGFEISDYFVQDLSITYLDVADEMIKKYADNSSFADLSYDRNAEEALVRGIFRDAILHAGDILTSPYRLTERFLRFLSSDERFREYLNAGLGRDVLEVERKRQTQLFEIPKTVSWERVIMKMPMVLHDIEGVIKEENVRYQKS
jgi:glucosyl-3-phosphoglycerate synthase